MPITLDPEEDVYVERIEYKAHKVHLGKSIYLNEVSTYKKLLEQGVGIDHCLSEIMFIGSKCGYLDIIKTKKGFTLFFGVKIMLKYTHI